MSNMALYLVLSTVFTPFIAKDKSWEFSIIGDTQINKPVMLKAIHSMNKKKLSFAIHLGDMDYVGKPSLWRNSMNLILKSKIPWFYLIGNHELYTYNPISYCPNKKKWIKFWYGYGDTFRVFFHRLKKFILLDSSTKYISRGHLNKLRQALSTAKDKSVFLFTHKPLPYYKNFKVRFGPKKKHYVWYSYLAGMVYRWRNIKLWKIIHKYKKKILSVFHGHDHSFRKYSLDGITVFSSGGGGGRLETKLDYYHYLIVKVNNYGYSVKVVKI